MTVAVLLFSNNPVQAESSSDLNLKVGEVISLTISSPCDSASYSGNDVTISLTPKSTGAFSSCPNIVTVGTNTTGFQLLFKSSNANLVNTVTSSYTIPSSANTTPNKLAVNTWGYAIPTSATADHNIVGIPSAILSVFDSSYTARTDTNPVPNDKYAKTPTSDAIVKKVDNTITNPTLQNNQTTIYYGVATDLLTRSGAYKTAITYTAIGEEIPPVPEVVIVPDIASTVSPTGNGTTRGVDGPQFSLTAVSNINFGANPAVTIGDQACTDITVNSAGTAMTCTGPITNLTTGNKTVKVNGQITTAEVAYDNINYPALQSLTSATCDTTPTIYRDARDSQLYYVAKLADKKCWMLDNLKYKPNGDTTGTVTSGFSAEQVWAGYLTDDATSSYVSPNLDSAKYADPLVASYSSCLGSAYTHPESVTLCGFFYNSYTVVAGTKTQQESGVAQGSICPANWWLPRGYNPYNSSTNDFAVLNGYMAGDNAPYQSSSTDTRYTSGWQSTGQWRGLRGGSWGSGVGSGGIGYYWSSSIAGGGTTYYLRFFSSGTGFIEPASSATRSYNGYGARCVIGS
jgi:uncharacterized protein (TIGR02145 family)